MPAYGRENTILQSAAPAAGNAAVATFAAATGDHRWRLRYVVVSYSAAATGGGLTISDTIFTWALDITGAGVVVLDNLDLQCGANKAVTITLAAVATVLGKVNAYATYE